LPDARAFRRKRDIGLGAWTVALSSPRDRQPAVDLSAETRAPDETDVKFRRQCQSRIGLVGR
jgi:hypothetical protein